MISIDSDILRNLTSAAYSALEGVRGGTERLASVVVHDDWNCSERDGINESIVRIKSDAAALQAATEGFLDAVRKVSNRFDEIDNSSKKAFEDVNVALADFYSIPSLREQKSVSSGIDGILKTPQDKTSSGKRAPFGSLLSEYEAASFTNSLKICRYSDIILDISKL